MGKKQVAVSLRKPPPADKDAFVAGSAEVAPASSEPSVARADVAAPVFVAPARAANEDVVVPTRAGERREITVYLPIDLAKQLSVRCMEMDRDISNVVAEALAKSLAAAAAEVETPAVVEVKAPPHLLARVRSIVADLRRVAASRIPLLGLA
jgi:hypothetical protein